MACGFQCSTNVLVAVITIPRLPTSLLILHSLPGFGAHIWLLQPVVVHANGWDKGPLLDILQHAGELTPQYRQQLLDLKATLEKQKVSLLCLCLCLCVHACACVRVHVRVYVCARVRASLTPAIILLHLDAAEARE